MANTMGTLDDNPLYELYPVGLKMAGRDMARRYYEHFFAHVAPGSWVSKWSAKPSPIWNSAGI